MTRQGQITISGDRAPRSLEREHDAFAGFDAAWAGHRTGRHRPTRPLPAVGEQDLPRRSLVRATGGKALSLAALVTMVWGTPGLALIEQAARGDNFVFEQPPSPSATSPAPRVNIASDAAWRNLWGTEVLPQDGRITFDPADVDGSSV